MEREGASAVPKNLQFKVGLLLGLTIMLAAGFVAYVLYARGVFEETQHLTLVADNAEGVSIGMDVSFSGFPVGSVQRIDLGDDGRARIEVVIPRKDARWLRSSSVFTLERGLVGGARIRAFTANLQDPPLPDGAERPVLRGDTQEEIPRMVASLRGVLDNLDQMTAPGSHLQASLASLRSASEKLGGQHGVLGAALGNDEDAKKVVAAIDRTNALLASLSSLSRRLDTLVGKTDERVFGANGVMDGAQRAVDEANRLLDDVRTSLQRVDRVLQDAQAVSANARAATVDLPALRAEVDASLRKVSTLIDEINRKWPFHRDSELRLP